MENENLQHEKIIEQINQISVFGEEFKTLQNAVVKLRVMLEDVGAAIDCKDYEQTYNEVNTLFDQLTITLLNHAARIQFRTYVENIVS